MTGEVVLSPAALADVTEIATSMAAADPNSATVFLRDLARRCRVLSRTPEIGTVRSDLADGVRSRAHGRHILYWSVDHKTIRIERVLHLSRYVPPPLLG